MIDALILLMSIAPPRSPSIGRSILAMGGPLPARSRLVAAAAGGADWPAGRMPLAGSLGLARLYRFGTALSRFWAFAWPVFFDGRVAAPACLSIFLAAFTSQQGR